jgi:hypothetical protein
MKEHAGDGASPAEGRQANKGGASMRAEDWNNPANWLPSLEIGRSLPESGTLVVLGPLDIPESKQG